MSIENEFNSRENKEMLWNVLYENNAFDNISKDNVGRIQSLFEESIASADLNGKDLITLNKEFIGKFIQKVDGFKHRTAPLSQGRKEQVNTQFKNKQQEFTNLLNPKPPTDIDFSDADDKPLDNSKIDDILEATIRQRALDVEIPPPSTANQTHKWFSGERVEVSHAPKNIKIGDEIKPVKKVAWADEIQSDEPASSDVQAIEDNFFKKLKPKQSSNETAQPSSHEKQSLGDDRIAAIEKKVDEIHTMLRQLLDRSQD